MSGPIFYILTQIFCSINTIGGFLPTISTAKVGKLEQKTAVEDSLARYVYLTFDDGPLPGTSNCVDICTRQKVAATFFEVGLHQSRSNYGKNLYNRIAKNDSLFVIANHSFTHAFYGDYLTYYHEADAALADFNKAQIQLHTGNNITRLPGNNAWNTNNAKRASGLVRPLVRKLDSVGYNVIGWDMEWRFSKSGRPIQQPEDIALLADSLLTHHLTKTKNHLVILMHDHMFRASADSIKLNSMISILSKQPHIQFRKLTSYPGLKTKVLTFF